jgi:hypothetical protein
LLLAEALVETPRITPDITMGALGMMLTIFIAAVGVSWWFTRHFSAAQVMFGSLQKDVVFIQTEMAQVKIDQSAQFASVNLELKHQTEILRKQDIMGERLSNEIKRIDEFGGRVLKLEDAFMKFRVGSVVSEQAQVPRDDRR